MLSKSKITYFILLLMTLNLFIFGCTDVEIIVPEAVTTEDLTNRPIDTTELKFELNKGSIGLIIETREIYRKGYFPTEATISFDKYPELNKTMEIDKYSNIAIFSVHVDSITEATKLDFIEGVNTKILIEYDGNELVAFQDNIIIDASNRVLNLRTEKKALITPLNLREEIPFLLIIEGQNGLLRKDGAFGDDGNDGDPSHAIKGFNPEIEIMPAEKFYFKKVNENRYKIRYGEAYEGTKLDENYTWGWMGVKEINIDNEEVALMDVGIDQAAEFEIIQDDEGWITFKLKVTNDLQGLSEDYKNTYMALNKKENRLIFQKDNPGSRMRIVTDVDWEVDDLGFEYQAPIIGPVRLDFAFRSVLTNCSSAQLTEEVGRVETKSRTTTFTTSESLEIFASVEYSAEINGSVTAGGEVGVPLVANGSVEATAGFTSGYSITTSATAKVERAFKTTETTTIEVSRIRTIVLPPFTVVDVYDAVKSVDNILIPYVTKLKISGKFKNGLQLSGNDIVTQLRNNVFSGIISEVNEDYVIITLKGNAVMNSLFQSSTGVRDIPDGCSSTSVN